ncbi:MAG: YbhB/YbcL family Raf kinase inhibitor-like protein [Chloroflexota bacterium]|nr:YbhB/YbcL family Raf kinase inhibitor-like protein [Chloroflexota bacterium]
MEIMSPAFKTGARIPTKFTCEGENVSPALTWRDVPEEAACLALIVDDPDAPSGTFTHWVVYNLPTIPESLDEGVSLSERLSEGLREGLNGAGQQGYMGPCPPRGHGEHRYYFRLYALDQKLALEGRVTRGQLLDVMEGHIIEQAMWMGLYSRS